MHSFGTYRRGLRHLAHRLKDGKPSAIKRAAALFASALPPNAAVVPMPSHHGRADAMLRVAYAVSDLRPDVRVVDALEVQPHESLYTVKKEGRVPPELKMRLRALTPFGMPVCIIDNVHDTGTTFRAAQSELPDAELFVLADTTGAIRL